MIPHAALPHRVTFSEVRTTGTGGNVLSGERTVDALVQGRRRLVRQPGGQDAIASATVLLRPDVEPTVGARMEWQGRTYTVLDAQLHSDLRRHGMYHVEVLAG